MVLGHADKDGPDGVLLSVPTGAPPPEATWSWGWRHINDWDELKYFS